MTLDPNEKIGPFGQTRAEMDEWREERARQNKAYAEYLKNNPGPYLQLMPQGKSFCSHKWHDYLRYRGGAFGLRVDHSQATPMVDICHKCGTHKRNAAGYSRGAGAVPSIDPRTLARIIIADDTKNTYGYTSSFRIIGNGPDIPQDASTMRWVQNKIESLMQEMKTSIEHTLVPRQTNFFHSHSWQLVRFCNSNDNSWDISKGNASWAKVCTDCGKIDHDCKPPLFSPMYACDYANELERYVHPSHPNHWLISWNINADLSGHHISKAAYQRKNFESAQQSADKRSVSVKFR